MIMNSPFHDPFPNNKVSVSVECVSNWLDTKFIICTLKVLISFYLHYLPTHIVSF